jgi:hypothetical protein
MIPPLFGKQEVGMRVKMGIHKMYVQYVCSVFGPVRFLLPVSRLSWFLYTLNIYIVCTFFVTFFSATIDGRNLIFGHKLHIGAPYCGKRFLTRQIPTSCLPTLLIFIHIEHTFCVWTGPKTLPTIWYTYMTLVTKYQISDINSYWEKCEENYLGRTDRGKTVYSPPPSESGGIKTCVCKQKVNTGVFCSSFSALT